MIQSTFSSLQAWYADAAGRRQYRLLQEHLQPRLRQVFGYHALQVGDLGQGLTLLDDCPVRHHLGMNVEGQGMLGADDAWPVATQSLDLVLLLHSLEYSHNPHGVLREAERCLVGEGYIAIVLFNDGFVRRWCHKLRCGFQQNRLVGQLDASRLRDWLVLLGFELLSVETFGYIPVGETHRLHDKQEALEHLLHQVFPDHGRCALVIAKKKLTVLTPLKPRWRARGLVGGEVAQPSLGRFRVKNNEKR